MDTTQHILVEVEEAEGIEALPTEINAHILGFLPIRDVINASFVSKRMYAIADANALWRKLYKRRWDKLPRQLSFLEDSAASSAPVMTASREQQQQALSTHTSVKEAFRHKLLIEDNWLTGSCVRSQFVAHDGMAINALRFSTLADDPRLFTASDDFTIKLWVPSTSEDEDSDDESDEEAVVAPAAPAASAFSWVSSLASSWLTQPAAPSPAPQSTATTTTPTGNNASSVRGSGGNGSRRRMMPKCVKTLQGHTSLVWSLDYDGRNLVSGSHDSSVRVWSKEGEAKHTFDNALACGVNLVMLNGNHVLATGKNCPDLKMYDIEAAREARSWQHHETLGVFTAAADFAAHTLFTTDGRNLKFWDIRTSGTNPFACPNIIDRHARFEVIAVREGSPYLITGDSDGDIHVWDRRCISQGRQEARRVTRFVHELAAISDIYFDNHKLVASNKAGLIKIWSISSLVNMPPPQQQSQQQPQQPQAAPQTPRSFRIELKTRLWCFQADDRALVCGDRSGSVHLLDFGALLPSNSRYSGDVGNNSATTPTTSTTTNTTTPNTTDNAACRLQ
eukprot:TRINITY_DN2207_c1_g1_i1.p1 TRINITY_DN2207_c1_g1~~TRINITY_DN2207_c1_g1_i1.p1  ORF type:complete len:585 (-),score=150.51 TRINITY_DN2207_c1_g1_i1:61-1749(-)